MWQDLLDHCGQLTSDELNRAVPCFGYPAVRLQRHHEIGAERYWIGVLEGQALVPGHVVLRTVAHLHHHQGRILAMCRLLGKPGGGLDEPHGAGPTA